MRDVTDHRAVAQDLIATRVLDALLREDVRGCVSQAALHTDGPASASGHAGPWLAVPHLGDGALWMPVQAASFMQDWRSAGWPILHGADGVWRALDSIEGVLAVFASGVAGDGAALFGAFADECRLAVEHRVLADAERGRWFAQSPARPDGWAASLLHYDRLASFHDHPLYPTARAKLGFDADALAAYGPEHQRPFALRWLALPRALVHGSGHPPPAAPWPTFADVGLDPALATGHALLPVHPFVWDGELQAMLDGAGLAHSVIRAPRAFLTVLPTLSVRTVVLRDAPEWHVKVPLTIRTLGARNIRTIKPSTIADGHSVQTLLADIVAGEPALAGRVLLTDERHGAHADGRNFLGYILRHYPSETLLGADVVPVAALAAPSPDGDLVAQQLARRWFGGDLPALFGAYLDLTLELHLTLWLRYGVALESNQQNSVLVFDREHGQPRLRLLLKDNDAARIHVAWLAERRPDLARHAASLRDARIVVDDALPLAQMFTTITLQLNIAAPVECLAPALGLPPAALYRQVRDRVEAQLARLACDGEDTALARRVLLDDERLYLKRLLVAATLAGKSETGAADVNKFYGHGAPNFLRQS